MDKLWYCLPKSLGTAFLFPLLDRLYEDIKKSNEAGLVLKARGSVIYLIFSKIEYIEVIGKTLFFHLNDGKTIETFGSISDLEVKLLHLPDFIKVHRAYIVNLCHIEKLETGCILTRKGDSIPISRNIYPKLKKDWLCKLMAYWSNLLINKELFWAKIKSRIEIAISTRAKLYSGNLFLDLKCRKTFCNKKELFLTLSEFDLLSVFIQNPNTIFSPSQLCSMVWGRLQ